MVQQNTEILSELFLKELLKLCFYKKDIIDIVKLHIGFHYIPKELVSYKHILKGIIDIYSSSNKCPTVGSINQLYPKDVKVLEKLREIVDLPLPEKDQVLEQLNVFVKRSKFKQLYEDVANLYNSDKQEEAIQLLSKESEKIANFSLFSQTHAVETIFTNFAQRQKERSIKSATEGLFKMKVPYGVLELDERTYGGSEEGDTDLFIARSGTGKTKWLRWRAVSAARRGFSVLHISAEGSRDKCLEGFDATWTAQSIKDLKLDRIDSPLMLKLEKISRDIQNKGGEIEVIAFEQFNTATCTDVRNLLLDYFKRNGKFPDLVTIDYLEKIHPGNGLKYAPNLEGEKLKREATADLFKNIAVEFKTRIATATQASDINPSDYNNPSWTMTRHNVAGAKGLADSFSAVFTWNVTSTEYDENIGRIFIDKFREHKGGGVIKIATNFDRDRYYDHSRTVKLFLN